MSLYHVGVRGLALFSMGAVPSMLKRPAAMGVSRAAPALAPIARAEVPSYAPRAGLSVVRPGASSTAPPVGPGRAYVPSSPAGNPDYTRPVAPRAGTTYVPSSPGGGGGHAAPAEQHGGAVDPVPDLDQGFAPVDELAKAANVSPTLIYVGGGLLAALAGLGIYMAVR